MNNYLLRNYIEICHIMLHEKIEAGDFLLYFSLSSYEYASDIEKIRDMEKNFGIHILFGPSQIEFRIQNAELFHQKFRYCRSFYYRHRTSFRKNKDILLQASIGRLFLWAENSISIEELADHIGYSRSSIRNAVKSAREFVETYDIHIINTPYYGLKVSGNEFDIRRCLLSLYSLIDINVIPSQDNPDIIAGYRTDSYEQIISILEEMIDLFHYPMINIEKRRITNYLIVQNARIRAGFSLDRFENCDAKLLDLVLQGTGETLAVHLARRLGQVMGFGPYTETEIRSIAILLYCANPNIDENIAAAEALSFDLTRGLSEKILHYFLDQFRVDLSQDPYFMRYLDYAVSQILIRHHFNMLMNRATNLGGQSSITSEYPLLQKVTQDLTSLLEDFFHYAIPASQSHQLIEIFSYYIQFLPLRFPRLAIAIISRTSRIEPAFIKRLIEKEVDPAYYSELDCLGYNDVANCANPHYDLIISDTVTQNYSCKVYSYHESRFHLHNLNDFIRCSRNLCQDVLHEVHALPLDLNDRESIASLFRLIQKSYNLSEGQLRDAFVGSDNNNGKIITVLYNPGIQTSRLIVGHFAKKVVRSGIRCSAYLFLAAAINPGNLRFFNVLLHELAYDPDFLETLIAEPNLEKINQHMNRILK